MNNRLSFAQILQKKQSGGSTHSSRISSRQIIPQPQVSNPQLPSLSELMDSFVQYPNDPDESFILSFDQSDMGMGSGRSSQDFEVGLNPLDSFIMTQSYLNAQKGRSRTGVEASRTWGQGHGDTHLGELSRKFRNVKENKNKNGLGNADNIFKFSTRNYLPEQPLFQSSKPGHQLKPQCHKQMITNTKIIQSQTCHPPICQSKRENLTNIHNIPRIQRSERVEQAAKKLSRYQVNYQESERKEEPEPPREKKKLILSKTGSQRSQPETKNEPIETKLKLSKKPSEEEQYLLAGIAGTVSNLQTSQQRRIQDAKKQINQYLQIREKAPLQPKPFLKQANPPILQAKPQPKPQPQPQVNYSFATQLENLKAPAPIDSFAGTKKELKEIEEENLIKENQRMLACIQYTQSEVDLEDGDGQDEVVDVYRRNIEVSQSIPERKDNGQPKEQYTLEKYLPSKAPAQLPPLPQQIGQQVEESACEYSEMVQKIQVQPSIEEQSQRDEVNNSDHPNNAQSQLYLEEEKEVKREAKKQVYHDVSSIDIRISDEGSEFEMKNLSGQKVEQPQIPGMEIPKLNVSDFESIQNISLPSMPSPIKSSPHNESPLHGNISQVQSNQPLSSNHSNESMNIHKHESSHGFIYKMRVHSRNNSFTSNYNSGMHGSGESHGLNLGNSHSSLYIRDAGEGRDGDAEDEEQGAELYNMSKYKIDRKKYEEVQVSVSVEIPDEVRAEDRETVEIQMQEKEEYKAAELKPITQQLQMRIEDEPQPLITAQPPELEQPAVSPQPITPQEQRLSQVQVEKEEQIEVQTEIYSQQSVTPIPCEVEAEAVEKQNQKDLPDSAEQIISPHQQKAQQPKTSFPESPKQFPESSPIPPEQEPNPLHGSLCPQNPQPAAQPVQNSIEHMQIVQMKTTPSPLASPQEKVKESIKIQASITEEKPFEFDLDF